MNARLLLAALALALALALGCARDASERVFGETDAGPPPPAGHSDFSDATAPPPLDAECAETTKQIYVLATDKSLYRFEPEKLSFVRIGTLGCPTAAGTFSMAIDRYGTAWVEFTDGSLFSVDTRDASCKPTSFRTGQNGFSNFGMGYAKDTEEGRSETLYVSGAGLAALDTKTFELRYIGSLSYGRTELTGRGASLFAYSITNGVVAGLNKSTAETEVTYRTTAIDPFGGFAFAHWGGDFWIFTGTTTSKVTRYSPDKDESKVIVDDTGMLIVGAGSSTCAPTTSPR